MFHEPGPWKTSFGIASGPSEEHSAMEGCTPQPVTRPFFTEMPWILTVLLSFFAELSKMVFLCPNKGQGSCSDKSRLARGRFS